MVGRLKQTEVDKSPICSALRSTGLRSRHDNVRRSRGDDCEATAAEGRLAH